MAPSKAEKKGLTLEKLASYDDVITDALVDKVGFNTARARQRVRLHSENSRANRRA
jgi:histone-lysine N-methyltransferase SUV420H